MLDWHLADLNGTILAAIEQRTNAEVAIALNGDLSGRLVGSLHDDELAPVAALETVLHATWDDEPVYAGVLDTPRYGFGDGTLVLTGMGPAARLTHTFLEDPLTLPAQTDQGEGIMAILAACQITAAERTYGVRELGVQRGTLTATKLRDMSWPAGAQGWQAITNVLQLLDGPDLSWTPTPDRADAWAVLNVHDRLGQDRSKTAVFEYGTGSHNLTDLVVEPVGAAVVNRSTRQGGQPVDGAGAPTGPLPKFTADHESRRRYGSYEDYEADPDVTVQTTIEARARARADAYAFPIPMFTMVLAVDIADKGMRWVGPGAGWQGGFGVPPRFRRDFSEGDLVTAIGVRGFKEVELVGRVTDVTLREVDQAGNVQVGVTCATVAYSEASTPPRRRDAVQRIAVLEERLRLLGLQASRSTVLANSPAAPPVQPVAYSTGGDVPAPPPVEPPPLTGTEPQAPIS